MGARIYKGLTIRKLADKSEGERVVGYVARNFEVDADGVAFFRPDDLERILYNPATPGIEHEPWPSAGVRVEDSPRYARIPTSSVLNWKAEGWLELEGETMVHRSGGPVENPWLVTHSFVHATAIVLNTVDGPVRYRVVENPDKWPAEKDGDTGFGGDVRWFYDCELEA